MNDEKEAGFGDLALRGGAQIDYTTGSGWVVGAGVLYSQLTGVSALFPILHLESPAARGGWRLSVLTPRASLWYRPHNTAVDFGFMAELDGSEYHLLDRKATLYDRQGRVVDESTDVTLAYSTLMVGPVIRLAEARGVSAFLQAGMALRRRYDFRSLDQGKTLVMPPTAATGAGEKLDFELERATFTQGNLQYAFGAN